MDRRGIRSAFAIPLFLLAGFATASAALAAPAGYAVEVFPAGPDDVRLPPELRGAPAPAEFHPADLLSDGALDHDLEIRWASRESPGLSGYRVTATIEGGALSGMTARWTVAAGSGEAGGADGLRLYRLRLPVDAGGPLHLRTALEALGADGRRLLVAVRDTVSTPAATPRLQGTEEPELLARSGGSPLALTGSVALPPPVAVRRSPTAASAAIPLSLPGLRTADRSGLRSRAPPPAPLDWQAVERS